MTEHEAAEELRQRQGTGARYDDPAAPATTLSWARRGTAYFARQLNTLTDAELDQPSLLPGWSRRHLIAHVGYNARALARLAEWARTGIEHPMYTGRQQRDREIAFGSTLPSRALRFLFLHSEVHLNVEWRDLRGAEWEQEVRTVQGRAVPVQETAWMRTREVWVHAVDLDAGGSYLDFPPEVLDALLGDVIAAWDRREEAVSLVLDPTDRVHRVTVGDAGGPVIRGRTADLVRWLTGRGARRLTLAGGTEVLDRADLPALPRWF
ncbi:maleylpyruvate isomerase [Cellulomonas denverensis]|uniref:Maleylpyruvate isomerase family mycothiol-dependent enzyme n=2 Tax=Cellulomonas denverensis TaxID=264297 RepID=A0A7X6KTZ8_9CELL|nr:maleylpyruvate isomerase family mycothiol-dependent enzyme [Cellulomonas denverensis]GIG26943.1 maleylpyruvate isomerase [Cellulomonas denverensis]